MTVPRLTQEAIETLTQADPNARLPRRQSRSRARAPTARLRPGANTSTDGGDDGRAPVTAVQIIDGGGGAVSTSL